MNSTAGSVFGPFLLVFLAAFVPTAFFSALNQKYFTKRQIRNSLAIACAAALALGLAAAALHAVVAATALAAQAASVGVNLADTLCAVLALALYGVLGERFFSDMTISRAVRIGILAACAAFFLTLAALYSLFPCIGVLCLMLASSAVDGYRLRGVERHILVGDDASSKNSESAVLPNGVTLTQKPNIYLLLLESYHSSDAVRHLYGVDDSATIATLQDLGYEIHPNTYANTVRTTASLATLLSGSLAGDSSNSSFMLDVLRENGYACNFFSTSPYIFCNYARSGDYVSFVLPESVAKVYAFAGPLVAQSKYLRLFARGIDIFPEEIDFESCFAAFQRESLRSGQQPTFSLMHFGANHFHEGRDVAVFRADYGPAFQRAESQLCRVTRFLAEHDPEALVIAIGDHGGLQYSLESLAGRHLQEALRQKGVSNTAFAYDFFSVLLAVRSPLPDILGEGVVSHVNLFRRVFAALGGGARFEAQEPNISSIRGSIVVCDGMILDPFRQGDGVEASMRSIARRHAGGTALPGEIVQLARMQKRRDPEQAISLLQDALRLQPGQGSVLSELGESHLYCNDPASCAYLKKAWKLAPQDMKTAALYYSSLLLHGSAAKAEAFFEEHALLANPEAVKMKLNSLRAGRDGNGSLEFALAASLASPEDDRIRLMLAWEYYERHLYHKAEKELQAILDAASQNKGLESWKAKITQQALYLLFFVRSELGDVSGVDALFPLCSDRDGSVHRWRFIALSAAFEKRGKINDAICCILDDVDVSLFSELTLRIGYLALRYTITEPGLRPMTEAANAFLRGRARQIEDCGIFDPAWYAAAHMKKGDTQKPLVHYMTHGVYHGLNPMPWFGTARYLIHDYMAWWAGLNPLIAFVAHGVRPESRNILTLDPLIALRAHTRQTSFTPRWIDALTAYYAPDKANAKRAA